MAGRSRALRGVASGLHRVWRDIAQRKEVTADGITILLHTKLTVAARNGLPVVPNAKNDRDDNETTSDLADLTGPLGGMFRSGGRCRQGRYSLMTFPPGGMGFSGHVGWKLSTERLN